MMYKSKTRVSCHVTWVFSSHIYLYNKLHVIHIYGHFIVRKYRFNLFTLFAYIFFRVKYVLIRMTNWAESFLGIYAMQKLKLQ